MKKLTITLLIIGFFIIASVSAVAVGAILSQSQVDNVDINTYDLEESFVKDSKTSKVDYSCEGEICSVKITYKTLDLEMLENETCTNLLSQITSELIECEPYYWSGKYIVVEKTSPIQFSKQWILDIKNEQGKAAALNVLKAFLKEKKAEIILGEKNRLKELQTKQEIGDISDVLSDLDMSA